MQEENKTLAEQIEETKQAIAALGDMRPGHLSKQMRQNRKGYMQLSYTLGGKGHTDYVRPGDLPRIEAELAAYGQFKAISARRLELTLAESKRKSSAPTQDMPHDSPPPR